MHAFNHVSTAPGNTPVCTCPPTIATALQNKKRRSGVKFASSQLCIQPCSIWTVGKDLRFQSLSLADILRNLASQVVGIPGFRGVKWSRHSVLWFVSLLMEFCFNPWKRKVPHHQPESGGWGGEQRLVGYVLKSCNFLFFVHQFTLQEERAHSTELGTDPLEASQHACPRDIWPRRACISLEQIQE